MTRTPWFGGNWKCNGTVESHKKLINAWNEKKVTAKADVVIGTASIHLGQVKSSLRKDFSVAAQNCYFKGGAFTGELSPEMIKDFGLNWVILGHSERRHIFKEASSLIAKKSLAAMGAGLKIVGCIGEQLEDRKSGNTNKVVESQLRDSFKSTIEKVGAEGFVIAYEPVWAIGTGLTASPKEAQEVHEFIRGWVAKNISKQVAQKIRIVYGGSVKPKNCDILFQEKDIDGFLVGGASLKPDFITIINTPTRSKL